MVAPASPDFSPPVDVLETYSVSFTEAKENLDRIARLAVGRFGTEAALIALVDADGHRIASCDGPLAGDIRATATLCRHTTLSDAVLVVENMELDERFVDHPLVTEPPHLRFFAGAPLLTREGARLGTLCVLDTAPCSFGAELQAALADLAAMVVTELELRRASKERHEREREIHRHEKRSQVLIEHALDMVGLIDADGRLAYLSPSVEETLGYRLEELRDGGIQYVHPDDHEPVADTMAKCLDRPNEPHQVEIRMRHKNGEWRWLHIKALSLMERPDAHGILLNGTDVTQQHRTEEALQRSKEKYEALFVTANVPIVIFEPAEEHILEANPQACLLYGYDHDALVGVSLKELSLDAQRGRPEVARTIEQGHTQNFETTHLRRDGTHVHLLVSATRIDYEGRTAILSINRDITQRKLHEARLATQTRLLEMIATGCTLDEVLPTLARFIEANVPGSMASVMLLDPMTEQLDLAAAPSLPTAFAETLHDLPVGPSAGTCGTAAYRGRSVITEDITTDPHWEGFSQYALEAGLRACWSTPVLARDGTVLGTFALYHTVPRSPSADDMELIETVAAHIASIAVERHRFEEALRESEERFRTLVANLPGLVYRCTYDDSRTTLYMSDGAENVLGYPPEAFAENPGFFSAMAVADDVPRIRQAVDEARRAGEPFDVEYRVRHADGSVRWVSDVGRAFTDGSNWWLDGFMLDITQRKEQEARLRVLEKALHDATESVTITDAELDPPGPRILYVNPAFEQMTGYAASDVLGKTPRILQGPETDDDVVRRLRAQLEAGESFFGETINHREDGTPFHIEWSISPVRDDDGAVTNFVAVQRDVTERKRAERELLRIRKAVEASSDGIAIADADDHVIYHNQALTDLLGYTADDINAIGGPEPVYADPSMLDAVTARVEEDGAWTGEVEMVHKNCHRNYVVSLRVDQIYDQDGDPAGAIIIHTDVTERKRAIEALEQALERERELSELKTRFVAMASHELRTPLSTIRSSAELISHFGQNWDGEKVDTHVARILSNVQDMTTLLEDVLLLGKAESNRLPYQPRRIDLVGFVRNLMDDVHAGLGNDHRFALDGDSEVIAHVDPTLLRVMLNNLLSNAVKYAPADTTVRVRLHGVDGRARIEVEDEGIGIPSADLPYLFEPFHRASNVGAKRGTGLGLSIVQRAVDMHGGCVIVESEEGAGSTFRVWLPLNHVETATRHDAGSGTGSE